MKNQPFQFIIYTFIILMSSCGDSDVDVTAPIMEVVSFDPEPVEDEICGTEDPSVFNLTGGDELIFDVVFEDNDALSQYKIDIHNNFDCHGHGGGSAPSVVVPNVMNQTEDWTVLDIQNISGTSAPVKRILDVPGNVTAGNYHFQIQVIDESGNDNPAAYYYSLKIKNPADEIPPQMSIFEPSTRELSAKKGESIRFAGEVSDNYSLSLGGNGVVYLSYTDLSSGNTFSTDLFTVFDEQIDKISNFEFDFVIPNSLTTGSYRVSIGANDGVRNVAEFEFFDLEVVK